MKDGGWAIPIGEDGGMMAVYKMGLDSVFLYN